MKWTVNDRPAYAYTGGKVFDATLPCVVFIHGALHDHSGWSLLARWCAHHGHSVLAVDLPGHGGSAGPPLPDVQSMADWVLALLDEAGAKQATFVGHSMGSLIALEAAARAPDRTQALVMMATAYPMHVSEALLATALTEPLRAIDSVNAWSHSTHAAKPSFPGPGTSLHGSNRALMRRMQAGVLTADVNSNVNLFHHEFSACNAYAGGEAAAMKVCCPVTFVLGSSDQMTPPKASRDLGVALKAKVVTIASGHNLMAEAPDAVLAALRGALSLGSAQR